MAQLAYAETGQAVTERLHTELRKRSFAGLVSADFSISQSNGIIAALGQTLYGRDYLDKERDTHSMYPGRAEKTVDGRTILLPIMDGHKTQIGSVVYVPPQRFVDGDRPRIAARIIADLDLTSETIDAASYEYLKRTLQEEWPKLFWFAAKVQKHALEAQR